eukprot:gnl/TRDRNA2_/TRDRNA2_193376_c0_seq1.p1 gnl/TRDRNA2_/TRDRNA2_193376_c0~~gnl/TRDRNA2_/TRDRNA2_193376_c0_seq1.p1  ORF type:complete len:416 (-),score=53.13 gnl/TRDRNA2_/TRDRNA2_193376_c0_seq1:46-1293(-)
MGPATPAAEETTTLLPEGQAWFMERMPKEEDFVGYTPVKPGVNDELEARIEAPKSWLLVLVNVALSFVAILHVIASWLFICYNQDHLLPKCKQIFPPDNSKLELGMALSCTVSVGIFWTFPILLGLVALFLYSRDVLLMHIYYECLRQKVHIAFETPDFFEAFSVRLLGAWGLLGCSIYYFNGKMGYRGLMFTLPYWIPICAFLALLFNGWDLKVRLVSVGNWVRDRIPWAKSELSKGCLVRDFSAQLAWSQVQADLKNAPAATTYEIGHLINFIVEKCRAMLGHEGNLAYEDIVKQVGGKTVMDKRYFGTVAWHGFDERNWAYQMIIHPKIKCERTAQYNRWYSIFRVYRFVMLFFILLFLAMTICSVHVNQGWTPPPGLTRVYRVLAIEPMSEQADKDDPAIATLVRHAHRQQ